MLAGCSHANISKQSEIKKGYIDLSQWNPEHNGNIHLNGQWEFYWNQLIVHGDFNNTDAHLTGYYEVPGFWIKYPGLDLPSRGYATYRLTAKTNNTGEALSILLPEIYTEFSLWINGKLIENNGSFRKETPVYMHPDVYTTIIDRDETEIVLQIKNDAHSNAGIGQSIIIGSPHNINRERNFLLCMDIFLISICFFAGLYHLILFLYKRNDPGLLFFSVFCLVVALRNFFSGETFVMQVFPAMPYIIGSRILTATIPICAASILLYSYYLHQKEFPKTLLYGFLACDGLYLTASLIYPTYFYASIFNYYLITVALSCFLVAYVSCRMILQGNKESMIFMLGAVFLIAGGINDTLHYNQIIYTAYLLSLGLSIFIIAQSVLLALRFSKAYQAMENMNIDFLTGAFNRRYFDDMLKQISLFKNDKPYAFIVFDVDDFKLINDQYGHNIGDAALVDLSNLLHKTFPASARIIRFGGDEFVIVMNSIDPNTIERYLGDLFTMLEASNHDSGKPYQMDVSYGYDIFIPMDSCMTPHEFFHHVDLLMYQNKDTKKAYTNMTQA